jgi:hypothetical protein
MRENERCWDAKEIGETELMSEGSLSNINN